MYEKRGKRKKKHMRCYSINYYNNPYVGEEVIFQLCKNCRVNMRVVPLVTGRSMERWGGIAALGFGNGWSGIMIITPEMMKPCSVCLL